MVEAARAASHLRPLALQSLATMYYPERQLFAFRVRPSASGLVKEGVSPRYTAITLIGLASASADDRRIVLGNHAVEDVCARLMSLVPETTNLGDVALTLWAARALGFADCEPAERRMAELDPVRADHPTVEVSWALDAACAPLAARTQALRAPLAERLTQAQHRDSRLFPHLLGRPATGRGHVACYADLVYPIHALSTYAAVTGDAPALAAAAACAERLCSLQGADGQWWWHYDYRTSRVIEHYPVYAIHQDAMGPMALFALQQAGGPDCGAAIGRGMAWLAKAPELAGASLVDEPAGIIWRKVARREPAKLSRYLNAAASALSPQLRVPGLDVVFPARAIDYEDRPYHLGWMLYAWSLAPGARA